MTAKRGQCRACHFSHRLHKDGTVGRHKVFCGTEGRLCEGSGGPPVPWDPQSCGGCLEYLYSAPMLAEACWSVGIEVGKDGGTLMREVLEAYHGNGHREAA